MQQAAELATAPPQLAGTAVQPLPLLAGVGALAIGAIRLAEDGWRPPLLWLLGLLLGATLYHASFGFTSAYRRMIVARDMRGVQAQLLLLALGTVLFAPVLRFRCASSCQGTSSAMSLCSELAKSRSSGGRLSVNGQANPSSSCRESRLVDPAYRHGALRWLGSGAVTFCR
jgi:hypothetical protein